MSLGTIQSRSQLDVSATSRADRQCRARKVKCLGKPPNACPNCLDIGTQYNWASADGRSAEARSRRLKSRNASTADVTGIYRAPDQQNTAIIQGAPGFMSTSVVPFAWPAGSTDTMYNSAEAMPPGSSTVLPWSTLEHFFNTFAGPQGSDTPLRGLAAPEIVAPNDFGDSVFGHITDRGDGVTKIMWLRICGQTAIVPGRYASAYGVSDTVADDQARRRELSSCRVPLRTATPRLGRLQAVMSILRPLSSAPMDGLSLRSCCTCWACSLAAWDLNSHISIRRDLKTASEEEKARPFC